ncbi:hypothetical protein SAMN05518672_11424 [Chitinophaga sp. CF118]|nr:hypothetical protein SAMN05518672_11424 [Chitinophaga sp. CF118]
MDTGYSILAVVGCMDLKRDLLLKAVFKSLPMIAIKYASFNQ